MFSQTDEELIQNLRMLVLIFGIEQQFVNYGQNVSEADTFRLGPERWEYPPWGPIITI